jgi:hypothetical protein
MRMLCQERIPSVSVGKDNLCLFKQLQHWDTVDEFHIAENVVNTYTIVNATRQSRLNLLWDCVLEGRFRIQQPVLTFSTNRCVEF